MKPASLKAGPLSANTSKRKRQEVACPSRPDLVLSDSCLLGYFNDDGARPSDATRTKIWSSIAANHPGSRRWCRRCRQSAAARLRRAERSPRERGTFHALEPAAQFWMDSVRPLEAPRCTVFHGCCGMGRERFEVVEDARRARERHQFLEGVLHKVAGRASAHWCRWQKLLLGYDI